MVDINEQIELARKARNNACVQHTHYSVGTCIRTKSGKYYSGANIENHGIQSICGERCAFCKALSEGEREFESIVVVGGQENQEEKRTTPCGYCRQFMSEYVEKDFKVYCVYGNNIEEHTLEDLLPYSYDF